MTKKNIYISPEINVVELDFTDVIASSNSFIPDDEGYSQYYPDPILP